MDFRAPGGYLFTGRILWCRNEGKIMKMKFYRFLYGDTGRCFMHFGEVRDTSTKEQFSFLYLKGTEGHVNQADAEHRLFLCPDFLDLVILEQVNENAADALKGILRDTAVKTLVLPEREDGSIPEEISGACESVCEIVPVSAEKEFSMEKAGWKLLARSCKAGSVTLAHGLNPDAGGAAFGVCIMNVKALDQTKRCCSQREPDGYGCALGCVLHQDHDRCGFGGKDGKEVPFTGTLLPGKGMSEVEYRELLQDAENKIGGIRFYGLPCFVSALEDHALGNTGYRRYLIGTGRDDLKDMGTTAMEEAGLYRTPVILKEGEGICCAGLLKIPSLEN